MPLLRNLARLGFQPSEGRQSDFQVGRLDGVEERPGDGGVDAIAPQGLAGWRSAIDMRPGTGIERGRPILQGADPHPPSTLAAQDNALEEGSALADGAPVLLRAEGTVVRQAGLVPQEVLPGERGGVDVVEENRPVLGGDPVGAALDPWGFARPQAGPGGSPAVDIGARIRGVVEESKDPGVASWLPDDLPMVRLPPQTVWEAEARRGEMLDHGEGRGFLLEEGQDEPDGVLDLLVGIEHELADRIEDEPDWGPKAQLALFSLLPLAPCEATTQPVEFRFTHGALEAQE